MALDELRTNPGLGSPVLIAATDVHYRAESATAAAILFAAWSDGRPLRELVERVASPPAYEPGHFYRRELPCLLAVLRPVVAELELVLVDGYVWLDAEKRPGLGAHLWRALEQRVPVIGVAKTAFTGSAFATTVVRGSSKKPLYVTAVGMDGAAAARHVSAMHGVNRIPTLLGRVDRLARES